VSFIFTLGQSGVATQQMKVAELVRKAYLIIFDEAPMMDHRAFKAVDRTLRDLMQLDDA
jgi:hypothetical protein